MNESVAEGTGLNAAALKTQTADAVREMLRDGIDMVLMGIRVHLRVDSITPIKETVKKPVTVPPELDTPQARQLWSKAQKEGWIDDHLQPTISQRKAAILASIMADKLGLMPRWAAFEQLWHVKDLASELSKATLCNYSSRLYNKYLKVLN